MRCAPSRTSRAKDSSLGPVAAGAHAKCSASPEIGHDLLEIEGPRARQLQLRIWLQLPVRRVARQGPLPGGRSRMVIDEGKHGDTDLVGPEDRGGVQLARARSTRARANASPSSTSAPSEAQRNALLTIMTGGDTDPFATVFAVFASTIETMHEPLFVPIEFEVDVEGRKARLRIAGHVEMDGEPIASPVNGAQVRAQIHLPDGFEYEMAEIGSARAGRRADGARARRQLRPVRPSPSRQPRGRARADAAPSSAALRRSVASPRSAGVLTALAWAWLRAAPAWAWRRARRSIRSRTARRGRWPWRMPAWTPTGSRCSRSPMWWVMMVAMMLPAAAPVDPALRARAAPQARSERRPGFPRRLSRCLARVFARRGGAPGRAGAAGRARADDDGLGEPLAFGARC